MPVHSALVGGCNTRSPPHVQSLTYSHTHTHLHTYTHTLTHTLTQVVDAPPGLVSFPPSRVGWCHWPPLGLWPPPTLNSSNVQNDADTPTHRLVLRQRKLAPVFWLVPGVRYLIGPRVPPRLQDPCSLLAVSSKLQLDPPALPCHVFFHALAPLWAAVDTPPPISCVFTTSLKATSSRWCAFSRYSTLPPQSFMREGTGIARPLVD